MKRIVLVILINIFIFSSIYHESLREYYELRYHRDFSRIFGVFELDFLHPERLFKRYKAFVPDGYCWHSLEQLVRDNWHFASQISLAKFAKTNAPSASNEQTNSAMHLSAASLNTLLAPIKISRQSGVILLGDSLMQGIAMRFCSHLRRMQVPCVSLAKQSSGLLHQRFYNYSAIMRKALFEHPKASVLVLVGVNDLFDTFAQGRKLEFGTSAWDEHYSQLIAELQGAVAFLALPSLREDKGASKALWFNERLRDHAEAIGARWLALDDAPFSAYEKLDGRLVRVRASDGVHFTTAGYEMLAQRLLEQLEFI